MRRLINYLLLFGISCCGRSIVYAQSNTAILGNPGAVVLDLKVNEARQWLVANLGHEIQVWNYESKSLLKSWSVPKIIAIDVVQDKVAGVSKSGDVVTWDIPTGNKLLEQNVSSSPLISVTWIDDTYLVAGSEDGTLVKMNGSTGEVVSKITHGSAVTAIACTENKMLITGDEQGMLTMYDVNALALKNSVKGHKSWIRSIKLSKNNDFITTSDDGYYAEWTQQLIRVDKNKLHHWVLCSDYSRYENHPMVVVGKSNGEIEVILLFGRYSINLDAMVNSVSIIESKQPHILVAVATYGKGIQVLDGKDMKFSTR